MSDADKTYHPERVVLAEHLELDYPHEDNAGICFCSLFTSFYLVSIVFFIICACTEV